MSRSDAVEFDFFAISERNSILSRNSSFCRLSRINSALLSSVFTTGGGVSAANLWFAGSAPLPTMNPNSNPRMVSESLPTAPLTIFYNGTVAVFDVDHDAAEKIIKEAEDGSGSDKKKLSLNPHGGSSADPKPESIMFGYADLPMARKQSLQRFLEKRKDRQILCPHHILCILRFHSWNFSDSIVTSFMCRGTLISSFGSFVKPFFQDGS